MHDYAGQSTEPTLRTVTCPLCEWKVLERRQCKSVCPGCGYVESCEDNFVPNQRNPDE